MVSDINVITGGCATSTASKGTLILTFSLREKELSRHSHQSFEIVTSVWKDTRIAADFLSLRERTEVRVNGIRHQRHHGWWLALTVPPRRPQDDGTEESWFRSFEIH